MGSGRSIAGARSAGPAGPWPLSDTSWLMGHFWKRGRTETDPERLSQSSSPNPYFASEAYHGDFAISGSLLDKSCISLAYPKVTSSPTTPLPKRLHFTWIDGLFLSTPS